ncbi:MAG: UDP-glucose/GDP-mannose dehydrogenase family protein [bacterium]
MKVAIIGAGYVGLVTGACFASLGNDCLCVDNNEEKIASLKDGIIPFYEPGLEELIKENKERLSFTTSIKEGTDKGEIIFICVPTPSLPNGDVDLTYIEKVSREIACNMEEYRIIVDKSTVPIETGEKVARTISLNNIKKIEFDVVSNPEFLREGSAIYDFMHPDRIVIGSSSKRAIEVMKMLYRPLNAKIISTDIRSAEIIKHAANSFLACKISFANALSVICDATGADINKVTEGMGLDKRIGKDFLNAGIGYGGSCFPKDVLGFIHIAEKYGYDFKLLKAVSEINQEQKKRFLSKVREVLWVIKEKRIGVLGLSFKPNTDDMRDAPSIEIITTLIQEGATIVAYDPKASHKAKNVLSKEVIYVESPYEAAEGADCLLVLTEWEEIKNIDLERIKGLMKYPIIIDGRNIIDKERARALGFEYKGMGR